MSILGKSFQNEQKDKEEQTIHSKKKLYQKCQKGTNRWQKKISIYFESCQASTSKWHQSNKRKYASEKKETERKKEKQKIVI